MADRIIMERHAQAELRDYQQNLLNAVVSDAIEKAGGELVFKMEDLAAVGKLNFIMEIQHRPDMMGDALVLRRVDVTR